MIQLNKTTDQTFYVQLEDFAVNATVKIDFLSIMTNITTTVTYKVLAVDDRAATLIVDATSMVLGMYLVTISDEAGTRVLNNSLAYVSDENGLPLPLPTYDEYAPTVSSTVYAG